MNPENRRRQVLSEQGLGLPFEQGDQGLLVHGVVECSPDRRVRHWMIDTHIEEGDELAQAGTGNQIEVRIVRDAIARCGRDAGGKVDLSVNEGRNHRGLLGNDAPHDLLQIWRPAPVIVEGFEGDSVVFDPFDKLIGARPHWPEGETIPAYLLIVVGGHDETCPGKDEQGVAGRLGKLEGDRVLV